VIKRLSKILPLAIVVSLVAFQLLSPALSGWAAPPALPVCGHNVVTGSIDSGPPDIATSDNEDYTAVVWAEDGSEGTPHAGYGMIKLAYSRAVTTTRTWTVVNVDTGTSNQKPSIVFDPISSNVVHIAYQQGILAGDSVIYYAKCTLGGSGCSTERASTGATANILRTNAQIAVNANGEPVIVYQESQSGGTPRSWMNYTFKPNGGSFKPVTGTNALGDNAAELNPTITAAGNVVHVAYAQDNDNDSGNGVSNKIKYLQLDASNMSLATLPASLARVFEPNTTHVKTPNYPAIDAKDSTVHLVWQFTNAGSSTQFNLAYNTSDDNGATWYNPHAGSEDYRYIPSNDPSTIASLDSSDTRSNTNASTFMSNLHPDVTLHVSGSITMTHIAWHEEVDGDSETRTEVMHSYFNGTLWQATAVYSSSLTQADVASMTNVSFLYKHEDIAAFDNDNVGQPKILFGSPGNRLQVVYLSQNTSSSILKVRYNGWQSGDPAAADSTLRVLDTDCDTYSNDVEYPLSGPPKPATCTNGDFTGDDVLDCEGDDLPDYLDINSDNDFQNDDVDGNRYEYSTDGAVFLPLILK
jgi:hypothetical protein